MSTVAFVTVLDGTFLQFVSPIAHDLESAGHRVLVVTGEAGTKVRPYHHLQVPLRRSLRGVLTSARILRSMARRENVDVVSAHTPMALLACRLAFFRTPTAVAATVHGTFLDKPGIRSWLFRVVEIATARRDDVTIVLNGDDRRFYTRIGCRRVCQAPVGGAGLSLEYDRPFVRESPVVPRLLIMGRVAPDKRVPFALEACDVVRTTRPVSVRVVGSLEAGGEADFQSTKVQFEYHPWTEAPQEELEDSDVLVSASLREGFSLVVAEALALGHQVVATSNRGVREIAELGLPNLTVVDVDASPREFACAILEALNAPQTPSSELLEMVRDRWSQDNCIQFYRRALGPLLSTSTPISAQAEGGG